MNSDMPPVDRVLASVLMDGIPLDLPRQPTPSTDELGATVDANAQHNPDEVEEDLIMFDSLSSPSLSSQRMRALPATPPNRPLHTVDDLLALSPMPPSSSSMLVDIPCHASEVAVPVILQNQSREATPSACDEDEVLLTLSRPASPPAALAHEEQTIVMDPQADVPLVVLTTTPEQAPQTPLRRSTRPRRSVSPYIYPFTTSPSKPASSVPSTPQPPSSAATKRRKPKPKVLASLGGTPDETQAVAVQHTTVSVDAWESYLEPA